MNERYVLGLTYFVCHHSLCLVKYLLEAIACICAFLLVLNYSACSNYNQTFRSTFSILCLTTKKVLLPSLLYSGMSSMRLRVLEHSPELRGMQLITLVTNIPKFASCNRLICATMFMRNNYLS